jgi:hypothetical protein
MYPILLTIWHICKGTKTFLSISLETSEESQGKEFNFYFFSVRTSWRRWPNGWRIRPRGPASTSRISSGQQRMTCNFLQTCSVATYGSWTCAVASYISMTCQVAVMGKAQYASTSRISSGQQRMTSIFLQTCAVVNHRTYTCAVANQRT